MIDIHSHILNEVDDGSDSLGNSIEILKKAEQARIFRCYFNSSFY